MIGLGLTFLFVSVVSLIIQAVSLYRLASQAPAATRTGKMSAGGLRRTAISRVVAALAYVVSAAYALSVPGMTEFAALLTFTAVQIMWWGNTLADISLRRQLTRPVGRHRLR